MPLRTSAGWPILFLLAPVIVFALVVVAPQTANAHDISLDQVIGQAGIDSIASEREVQFVIRLTNSTGTNINGLSNGFRLYSYQLINWQPITADTISLGWDNWFTFISGILYRSANGSNADTVAFYGSDAGEAGIPTTFDGQVWRIHTAFPASAVGAEVCLDSCYYPPGGTWLWATDAGNTEIVPTWSGPHCFTIVDVPNVPPGITNNPDSIIGNHCDVLSYQFEAIDPDSGDTVTWELIDGPGSIGASTGLWQYQPSPADVGQVLSLAVRACDGLVCTDSAVTKVIATNLPAEFTDFNSGCQETVIGYQADSITHLLRAIGVDCDDPIFSISGTTPAVAGTYDIDPASGSFVFVPALTDVDTVTFHARVEDQFGEGEQCDFYVKVLPHEPLPGITFSQIDWKLSDGSYQTNSDWGLLEIDVPALTSQKRLGSGFVNVLSDRGWVVPNIPIDSAALPDTIHCWFELSDTSGANVTSLQARVEFTPNPIDSFHGTLIVDYPVGTSVHSLGAVGGDISYVGVPPGPILAVPVPGLSPETYNQPDTFNIQVQAANNQCAPMAAANSLAYLKERFGLSVPHYHGPGLRGDTTLVGQLDSLMGRTVIDRSDGGGVTATEFLSGKMAYLNDNDLRGKVILRHQGTGSQPYTFPTGAHYEANRMRSANNGEHVTYEWVREQILNGEDVELGYGHYDTDGVRHGGHAVRVTGCADIGGVRYLWLLHDAEQTDEDPSDNRGLQNLLVRLGGGIPLNFGSNDVRIEWAHSESADSDRDSIVDLLDNAPYLYNPRQEDLDSNGIGDVAESEFLMQDTLGGYSMFGSGYVVSSDTLDNPLPGNPTVKDMWYVGGFFNSGEDTSRVVVNFSWIDDQGIEQFSPLKDTTWIGPQDLREIFGSHFLEYCPEQLRVHITLLEGMGVITVNSVFYHICYDGGGCCRGIRGNVDGDPNDLVNISDMTYLVAYLFSGGAEPPCYEEGDVNGDSIINISDMTYLVAFLFSGGPSPAACP
jgi:hypothetical protein